MTMRDDAPISHSHDMPNLGIAQLCPARLAQGLDHVLRWQADPVVVAHAGALHGHSGVPAEP
jgi:hypothetical protein